MANDIRLAKGEDVDRISSELEGHINNIEIHVTLEQKTLWDAKVNQEDMDNALSAKADKTELTAGLAAKVNTYVIGNLSSLTTAIKTSIVNAINELNSNKVSKTDYASIDNAGVIKLYSGNNTNRSGIVVGADGTAYVYTGSDYGTNRSGDGRIQVARASDDEILARTQGYM